MSPACHLPCCRDRLATTRAKGLRTALAALVLWPAIASGRLSLAESAIPSVGPASREQQRPADVTRTAGDVVAIATTVEWAPVVLVSDIREELNELQWAFEHPERVAQVPAPPESDPIVDEQVPVGELERDPCYVSGPIVDVRVNIAPTEGALPENVAFECKDEIASTLDPRMIAGWSGYDKHWAATGFYHRPLYFQEINAERYGYTCGYCVQPLISGARFFGTIAALPYLMVAQPPCECVYSLGHYRPGTACTPWQCHRPAARLGAGVAQALVVVGLIVLIP